jgi:hypothetical protein
MFVENRCKSNFGFDRLLIITVIHCQVEDWLQLDGAACI